MIPLPPSFSAHAARLSHELAPSFTIADICVQGNPQMSVRSPQAQPVVLEHLAQLAKGMVERCQEYAQDLIEECLKKEWMESVKWGDKEGWEWIVHCEEDPNAMRIIEGLEEEMSGIVLAKASAWPKVSQQWKDGWEMISQAKLKTFELVNEVRSFFLFFFLYREKDGC